MGGLDTAVHLVPFGVVGVSVIVGEEVVGVPVVVSAEVGVVNVVVVDEVVGVVVVGRVATSIVVASSGSSGGVVLCTAARLKLFLFLFLLLGWGIAPSSAAAPSASHGDTVSVAGDPQRVLYLPGLTSLSSGGCQFASY